MENLNVFVKEDNQVNEEKPPPRVCPRCNSDNTKFCYYNNYSVSQPRYFCKNCRRYWTHGGALRNIPIGGSCRKSKRPKIDQPSASQMVSVENQPFNHQPFRHVQENNEFVGSFGGSPASSNVIGNHFGPFTEICGITNVPPIQNFPPMYRLDFPDELFQENYYDVGPNDLIGNPFINQSIGGYVDNHKGYRINQVDQHKWNESFDNAVNMNHRASASGSRRSSGTEIDEQGQQQDHKQLFA